MPDQPDAATAIPFSIRPARLLSFARLVQLAPGPQAPDVRDRAGAQLGMMLLIAGGTLFWFAVTALAVYVLR